ncbi:MAG: fibronectin type III domain-containing protein [Chthonomonas sp.]|nr:fibronectin type III domain-containing protein [Chthonomonas sp.]
MTEYKFVIPASDAGANAKFQLFMTGADAELLNMGYDGADLLAIVTAANNFDEALFATENARLAYRNQVGVKNEALAAATETIRIWAQRVKTNPLATPEILAKFGIEPSTPAAGPVTTPTDLSASPYANGTCNLKWGSNGNVGGTTYVIEVAVGAGAFGWCGNTTKRTFIDEFATPGQQRTYRVRAQRAGLTSPPSAEATIYFGEGDGFVELAA